jgi:hypothetical protein
MIAFDSPGCLDVSSRGYRWKPDVGSLARLVETGFGWKPETFQAAFRSLTDEQIPREVPPLLMPGLRDAGNLSLKTFALTQECQTGMPGYHLESASWSSIRAHSHDALALHLCVCEEFTVRRVILRAFQTVHCIYDDVKFDATIESEVFGFHFQL